MEDKARTIRDWPKEDQPRNKLYIKKTSDLSTAELLAILIGSGNAKYNSLELAKQVMTACKDSLTELSKCSILDLIKVYGIGHAKASTLVAFGELSRRQQMEKCAERNIIKTSIDAAAFFSPHLRHLSYEAFIVAFLSQRGHIIDFKIISRGGITGTIVDPRIVFKEAIAHQAVSIVVSHNHPSGSTRPSKADEELTEKLRNGGKYIDIKLIDHIIIGETDYFSFADQGILR
ncbi:MAG TPA: DNA repair protein RadC [Puia sp.]|jgi:DNA repair protein RadC